MFAQLYFKELIMAQQLKKIYIILSQTGTLLSNILKTATGATYNHVSISLDPELRTMYSFGRLNPKNPFIGGFVKESIVGGTFAHFPKTEALVLEINVTPYQYSKMKYKLETMACRASLYHYNYIGLFLAIFKIRYKKRNCFYCSEFVKDMLIKYKVKREKEFDKITHPIYFLNLKNTRRIYSGKLKSYKYPQLAAANKQA